MDLQSNKNSKKKDKYFQKFNKSNKFSEGTLKGFIVTCNHDREKNAIKEAYNFLANFVERLYPKINKFEKEATKKIKTEEKSENKEQQTILPEDLDEVKKKDEHLFYNLDIGVKKGVVFIKINSIYDLNPKLICKELMEETHLKKNIFARYCHRIIPVERALKADLEDYKTNILEMINSTFPLDRGTSWLLDFKCRNNNKFHKKDFLDYLLEIMPKQNFVSYKEPEFTVYVEINQQTLCLSILENYFVYKKYSLHNQPQIEALNKETIITNEGERKKKEEIFEKRDLKEEIQEISEQLKQFENEEESDFKLL